MVKLLVLFGNPDDATEFFEYFEGSHSNLLLDLPEARQILVNRVGGAAIGTSPYCLIVEIDFADERRMQNALNSEAGIAMAHDYANFATGGTTHLFCHAERLPAGG